MVNPVPMGTQGFCSYLIPSGHIHDYDASKDISDNLPYTINPGDSLSVAILRHDPAFKVPVYKIVVFMFVDIAPAAGAFRPGFYGTDRSIAFNESDLDWSVLQSLDKSAIPSCPTQATAEDINKLPALPWHEWGSDWTASLVRPQINTGNTNDENTAQFASHLGFVLYGLT